MVTVTGDVLVSTVWKAETDCCALVNAVEAVVPFDAPISTLADTTPLFGAPGVSNEATPCAEIR